MAEVGRHTPPHRLRWLDEDERGHVTETKIRCDPQLAMQPLDYWAWADAHRLGLAQHIDADPCRPFHLDLDLVLGHSVEPLLHPNAAATLEALGPEVN